MQRAASTRLPAGIPAQCLPQGKGVATQVEIASKMRRATAGRIGPYRETDPRWYRGGGDAAGFKTAACHSHRCRRSISERDNRRRLSYAVNRNARDVLDQTDDDLEWTAHSLEATS